MVQPVREQRAVGEPGQRVVEGVVDELAFEVTAFGGRAVDDDQPGDLRLIPQIGRGQLD